MSRKHTRRRATVPMPPRGLRPKLTSSQVEAIGMAHIVNLDAIAKGQADESVLWQWVGGLFTWSRTAELLDVGVPEIEPQLELATSVIERYGRTGRVLFTGPEYQLAKFGVLVMDELASLVDQVTANAAADWSEAKVAALSATCRARAAPQSTTNQGVAP